MITLAELQLKEVVVMEDGRRLGFISDLEIDESSGFITAIIIAERQMRNNFFSRASEIAIQWGEIVTIGVDIILVKNDRFIQLEEKNELKTSTNNEES